MENIKNIQEPTIQEKDDKATLTVGVEVERVEVALKEFEAESQEEAIKLGKQLLELSQQAPDLDKSTINEKFHNITSNLLKLKYEETVDTVEERVIDVDDNILVDGDELVNILEEIDSDAPDDEDEE